MNARKRLVALLLSGLLITSLAGCGGGGGSTASAGTSSTTASNGAQGGTVPQGFAKVSWNPPQDEAVVGYKLYYGTAPRTYSSSVNVGLNSTYTVSGLATGTYYFAVTAVDSSGNESGYSNEASKTVS